ncbi:3-isopropylmalate dehydratase small subunit [Anaerolinea thermophila]|uniref:3-isopropylmalate dehydratase small subunit n=1 Tax=Anaerolinea thermophila (strain DSM 14523 / JCM 11388 / NBRC 100420 / UNI-1) TaxID=926569 RepID=E8N2Q1_ANATU|nr:3-isopropylmalate dehydratase small subunit [Anaerolinea thermophila]BAJ62857.1 3-isopropylmalate dehydratase small subunit [Anaerolinea thermophila UNI-1]
MGRAWKFGENLNTDEIIPARYNITIDEKELAAKAFCEIRPEFAAQVQPGDVIVAGRNFGCGSSREHAAVAIRGTGVQCVIAPSFARIFFRNAINIGLPILECPQAVEIEDGDQIEVNLSRGEIRNLSQGKVYPANPLPAFVLKIVEAGGLVRFLREHDIEELTS